MTAFEKTFQLVKNPWTILSFLLLLALLYYTVDLPVALFFYQLHTRTNWALLKIFSLLGQSQVNLIFFLLLGLYFKYLKKNTIYETRAWFLFSCVIIVNLINYVLKISFGRARPDLYFLNHSFGFYWFKLKNLYWSFPSGHAVTSTAVASGLGIIFQKYFFAFLGIAFLIMISRVVFYKHYVSDVMAGLYLSLLVIGLFVQVIKNTKWAKFIFPSDH